MHETHKRSILIGYLKSRDIRIVVVSGFKNELLQYTCIINHLKLLTVTACWRYLLVFYLNVVKKFPM